MSPLRAPPLACWSISAALELPRSREQQNLCVSLLFFPRFLAGVREFSLEHFVAVLCLWSCLIPSWEGLGSTGTSGILSGD